MSRVLLGAQPSTNMSAMSGMGDIAGLTGATGMTGTGTGISGFGDLSKIQQLIGLMALKKGQWGTAWNVLSAQPQQAAVPTESEFKNKLNAAAGLAAVQTVRKEIEKSGGKVMLADVLPGYLGRIAGASTYRTARGTMTDVLTRLRTGAALNEQEIAFYTALAPQIGDRPEDINYKLKMFEDLYMSILKSQRNSPQSVLPSSFVPLEGGSQYGP